MKDKMRIFLRMTIAVPIGIISGIVILLIFWLIDGAREKDAIVIATLLRQLSAETILFFSFHGGLGALIIEESRGVRGILIGSLSGLSFGSLLVMWGWRSPYDPEVFGHIGPTYGVVGFAILVAWLVGGVAGAVAEGRFSVRTSWKLLLAQRKRDQQIWDWLERNIFRTK